MSESVNHSFTRLDEYIYTNAVIMHCSSRDNRGISRQGLFKIIVLQILSLSSNGSCTICTEPFTSLENYPPAPLHRITPGIACPACAISLSEEFSEFSISFTSSLNSWNIFSFLLQGTIRDSKRNLSQMPTFNNKWVMLMILQIPKERGHSTPVP